MLESSFDSRELEDGEYYDDDDDSDVYGLMTMNQAITNHRYPDIVGQDVTNLGGNFNIGSHGLTAQGKIKQARQNAAAIA